MLEHAPHAGIPGIRQWCYCVMRKGIGALAQVQPGAPLQLLAHYTSNRFVFPVIHSCLTVSFYDHTYIQWLVS